jgi:hypothetical protein
MIESAKASQLGDSDTADMGQNGFLITRFIAVFA